MRFAGCGTEESEPWLSQTMPSVRPRACPTPAFIGYRRIANRSRRYRRATASARPAVERRKRPCDGRCCSRCCRLPLSSAGISMSPAALSCRPTTPTSRPTWSACPPTFPAWSARSMFTTTRRSRRGSPLQARSATVPARAGPGQCAARQHGRRSPRATGQLPQHAGPNRSGPEGRRLQHGQLSAPGAADRQQLHAESHL